MLIHRLFFYLSTARSACRLLPVAYGHRHVPFPEKPAVSHKARKFHSIFFHLFTATQTNGPVRPKAPCAELPCSQTTDGFVCSAIIKEFVNFPVKQKNRFHLCRRYLKSLSGTLQYFAKRRYDLFPNRHPCSAVP